MVGLHDKSGALAEDLHFYRDALGCFGFDELLEGRDDLVGILFGNQADAYLCGGSCGDHSLAACACKAPGDAMNFKGWTRPDTFEHGEFRFAREAR